MISIMQGDSLKIPIVLRLNGTVVPSADIAALRVTIGNILKTYPGDITIADNGFVLPLTQEETFSLPAGLNVVVVRPKFADGSIRGWTAKTVIDVCASIDREVF